jgi:hypothetical protein
VEPPAAAQRQWDDGGNALALGPRLMLCYERNVETNARLEAAGVEVIRIPGSELGCVRGGPRALACAVHRDSVAEPVPAAAPALALVSGQATGPDKTEAAVPLEPVAMDPLGTPMPLEPAAAGTADLPREAVRAR